jgi:hypothetical protein
MLPYFPFLDQFNIKMGIRTYGPNDHLIEIDEHYLAEVHLKHIFLVREHEFYYHAQPDTLPAQWEVLALTLEDMARSYPEHFRLEQNGDDWSWSNALLGEITRFRFGDAATLPFEPLDWVGRQVQEDLLLLSPDEEARLVAGQLCFPNGWSLRSKWGQSLMRIHAPAPGRIEPTIQSARKLFTRMHAGRPVWRASWNFKLLTDLDQSDREIPRVNADLARRVPSLTIDNIGEQIWLRIERQSFVKLPQSQYILFVIHTYHGRIGLEASDPDRAARMLGTIQTTPRDLRDYKAITPIEDALVGYLQRRCMNHCEVVEQVSSSH